MLYSIQTTYFGVSVYRREIERWTGVVLAVIWSLQWSVVVKRALSEKKEAVDLAGALWHYEEWMIRWIR